MSRPAASAFIHSGIMLSCPIHTRAKQSISASPSDTPVRTLVGDGFALYARDATAHAMFCMAVTAFFAGYVSG